MSSRRLDILYGVVLLGMTVWLFWVSVDTGIDAPRVTSNPMRYPQLLLLLLMACSVALIARGVRTKSEGAAPVPGWQPLAVTLVAAGTYLLAFDRLGFVPSTLLFIPTTSWLLGFRRPLLLALVTIGFTCLVWYSFHYGFNATPPGLALPTLAE